MDYHNYFITLEDKFQEISKYVEIDHRNYRTFSSEIAFLFMAACSEFEVVAKELSKVIDSDFNDKTEREPRKIRHPDIMNCLTDKIPEILDETIDISRFKFSLKPLEEWKNSKTLSWWNSYNRVKHHRTKAYELANLENLIQAMSALQIVNYYLIWKRDCPRKSRNAPPMFMTLDPEIFKLENISYTGPFFTNDVFDK